MYRSTITSESACDAGTFQVVNGVVTLSGAWLWSSLSETMLLSLPKLDDGEFRIDGTAITCLDTTGAYFIKDIVKRINAADPMQVVVILNNEHLALYNLVVGIEFYDETRINPQSVKKDIVTSFIHLCHTSLSACASILIFFGHVCYSFGQILRKNSGLYLEGMVNTIATAGIGGILITSSLCFLIGVNLTYQMAPQFVTYGASIYVVNFLGISLLREVTPLLTAIIVAGRSGSAIAAHIGTMKVQEEIDAFKTMGISPMNRLVIPRVVGLLLSLPILTMLADVFSMLGGMIFAGPLLEIDPGLFLNRLQTSVSINNFWVGIFKSFFFACTIGIVGCYCGFKVESNADSIGTQTTRSVVLSICLIITIDALFAILFKLLGVK